MVESIPQTDSHQLIAVQGKPIQAASSAVIRIYPRPAYRAEHLTTRSLPIKRLQKAAEKKQRALPMCACVRAHRKKEVVRAAIGDVRAREREKKKRRPAVHTVFTHMYTCVRARACMFMYRNVCMCRGLPREGYFFEKPLDERETHLDRGSVLPGHRKLSRAAHPAREKEREREEGGKS